MIVGSYTLDVYCDLENEAHTHKEFPHEYTDEYGAKCRAKARKERWLLLRNGKAVCPKCNNWENRKKIRKLSI